MVLSEATLSLASQIVTALGRAGIKLATAESCTGGLIAGALTAVPGSSDVVERGFVTYSNEAKTQMLGVSAELISDVGAVSADVAEAMASGALMRSNADIAVAVTGIAGPGGGSADKPVGLVFVAAASRAGENDCVEFRFGEVGRDGVRDQTVLEALRLVKRIASGS